jgi:hypothetical protein
MSLSVASGRNNNRPVIVRHSHTQSHGRMGRQKMAMRVRPKKRLESMGTSGAPSTIPMRQIRRVPGFSLTKGLVFAGLVFLLLLCKLFIRLEILDMSYKIEHARNELISQDALLRELKARRAVEANPRKVTEDAKIKLQLRPTTPQQIRKISR